MMQQDSKCLYYKDKFDEFAKSVGNRFDAVYAVGKAARKRAQDLDNVISHSEALSWLISGVAPSVLRRRDYAQMQFDKLCEYIDRELSIVSNVNVRRAARASTLASIQAHHLMYKYTSEGTNEGDNTRVRIWTNKLYDTIQTMLQQGW